MKFRNHFNATDFATKGETNTQPSLTIPDQTMSMREILQRHTRGLPIEGAKVTFYEEEGEMSTDEFRRLDLADQEQIIRQRREELEEIKAKANEKALALKERQEAQRVTKALEAQEKAYKRSEKPNNPDQDEPESTKIS